MINQRQQRRRPRQGANLSWFERFFYIGAALNIIGLTIVFIVVGSFVQHPLATTGVLLTLVITLTIAVP